MSLFSGISPRPSGLSADDSLHLMDLKLLHHYNTSPWMMSPSVRDPKLASVWVKEVPQMAFDQEYLLHAMLCTAAFHLRKLNPLDPTLITAAHHHLDKAISKYRTALPTLNKSNLDSLCAAGMMMTTQVRLAMRTYSKDYTLPIQWLNMGQGVRALFNAADGIADESFLIKYIQAEPSIDLCELASPEFNPKENRCKFSVLLKGLPAEDKDTLAYETTLRCVDLIYRAILRQEPEDYVRRKLSGTIAIIPIRFTDLLSQQDPRAMAILAHWYACTKFVDNIWWLQGAAEYEVRGILNLMPTSWLWAMEWPLKVIASEDPLMMEQQSLGRVLNELEVSENSLNEAADHGEFIHTDQGFTWIKEDYNGEQDAMLFEFSSVPSSTSDDFASSSCFNPEISYNEQR
ncbi:hypothetical protein MMC12_004770 [Toensbergia leucococca]|nr:hypothetical protein [Toensbergia leucococca]